MVPLHGERRREINSGGSGISHHRLREGELEEKGEGRVAREEKKGRPLLLIIGGRKRGGEPAGVFHAPLIQDLFTLQ